MRTTRPSREKHRQCPTQRHSPETKMIQEAHDGDRGWWVRRRDGGIRNSTRITSATLDDCGKHSSLGRTSTASLPDIADDRPMRTHVEFPVFTDNIKNHLSLRIHRVRRRGNEKTLRRQRRRPRRGTRRFAVENQ